MATVQLKQVRKSYGATEIIRGIDLTIEDRELVVFVGPSGCGKSTVLRLIAGLEEITSGDLLINNQRVNDTAPAKRGLALVFQSYALYPHMSVAENMAFSLKLAGVSKAERQKKVLEAARILHLEAFLDRKPAELSGGQRQRVAIGRAIVRNPKVFLFDEPLSNLDAELRVKMRLELTNLHKQLSATMIYVTHDQVEAMTMADKIVVLQAGNIEQAGSPMEVYRNPQNLFVAGFLGSPRMNFLPVVVQQVNPHGTIVTLPDETTFEIPVRAASMQPGDKMTLGVRPEHITLVSDNGIPARVRIVEHLGGESYLHVQIPHGETLVVKVDGEAQVISDQVVQLKMNKSRSHLFDRNGDSVAARL
jgi:multiple sugar transport system ATP-binding protein